MYNKNENINKANLCASFEKEIADILIKKTLKAAKMLNIKNIALAGGVSANSYIRERFFKLQDNEEYKIYFPNPVLCTDNAAMIASAGYYNFKAGNIADLTLNAVPNLKLNYM